MKKRYLICGFLASQAFNLLATYIPAGEKADSFIGLDIQDIRVSETNNLEVEGVLNFSRVNLKGNRELICTPMFVSGLDTVKFTPFSIAGHNRWIWDERNGWPTPVNFKGWGGKKGELSNESQTNGLDYSFSKNMGKDQYEIFLSTPYNEWMGESNFMLEIQALGCSDCPKDTYYNPLAALDLRPAEYVSDFIFVTPVAEEVKTRNLSGRAYVEFQVNKTNILPDFRNNRVELSKITATIDSVKNDKDITVTSISISGTASPEGSYENNVKLAKGRTEALRDYVTNLYRFPKKFIKTSFEPVDWTGLAEWLENNQIENRDEILAIVNGNLEPYARNQKIKTSYPKQYQWLLQNVYPSLRHSDYVIEYNIRNYANVDEIIQVMTTAPQKLSLNELFIVANNQPEGSDLYNESFEIAVKMYPDDEVANLNAATVSMMHGDYTRARRYLSKAGNSEEAEFTRAQYEALAGDKEAALESFITLARNASSEKVREKAQKAAENIEETMRKNNIKFEIL